ncbi:T9SS type A sorting domain-containing protein [Flavobacterium sp. F372]|uniref:Aminopeptidase N n=1 Tax=Flavobacterium bernardetii TaxID=2813823 RepID=A0ABR7IZH7_9FLAO|nr:M1 family aminopeptidase [Flavobacterium bernardetii]MBC5835047.1 T9SS type A sorting domain-containing protein [Flavobacterium bernardetii]NHF70837.1 T9SS type A sorting domain-containing protein [Flavobacterium bernardetii]
MKKTTQIFFVLMTSFCFSQSTDSEFNGMVESEMKSASTIMNVQVNPNTQNYDVTYHELRFTINPAVSSISGIVKTTFTALSNMNSIAFDMASALTVSSVTMNSANLTFSETPNQLNINFPATVTTGTSATVIITYSGIPPNTEGEFSKSTHAGTPVLWTLSEPFGARSWWPCKQDLNDKVNSIDVYVTAPSQYNSVANGLQQSRVVAGASATTHFKHLYPIPAYLIAIAVTNYEIFNQQAGLGTVASPYFPIVNYLYPEESASSQASLSVTPAIMNFFETKIGPYPFRNEKYGHARAGLGGGMEHTTVSFMNSWSRSLIAHELAHQWFGDKITCGSWKDIWLNEGLTEYMAGLVVEEFDNAASFVSWKNSKINNITSSPTGATYLTDLEALNSSRIFSGRLTYNKGSMITHMLRWKMGDVAFFNALNTYLADPALAYGYAVTSNFKSHLETAYGASLTEFFNDWLYNQGYPTYDIVAQNWGAGQAKIIVNQTQSDASVSFFEMPLQIRLLGSSGQTHDVVVNNTTNAQEFIVSVPFVVTGVTFDPNKHIISNDNTETLGNETFDSDKAVSLFPVPAENELNIQFPSSFTLYKVEVFNNLGQLLATDYKNTINTSQLSSGVHFLKIETSEGVFHKNFIKK